MNNVNINLLRHKNAYCIFSLNYRRLRQEQRTLRDPFTEITDKEFVKMFRLTKANGDGLVIIEQIKPHLNETIRVSSISPETKIMCALRFFATGTNHEHTYVCLLSNYILFINRILSVICWSGYVSDHVPTIGFPNYSRGSRCTSSSCRCIN